MSKIIITFTILGLLPFYSKAYKCGFHSSSQTPVRDLSENHHIRILYDRDSDYKSLRIKPVFINSDLDSGYTKGFEIDLVGGAVNWYSNALKIKRLSGKLTFPSLGGKYCGDYFVNATEAEAGYEDADVVIFIEATSLNPEVLGSSEICYQDPNNNYPLVGYVHLDTTFIDEVPYGMLFASVVHQFAHVLAFNDIYFTQYVKEDGTFYSLDEVIANSYERNHTVYKIITPRVVQKAQEFFACSTMEGMELESTAEDSLSNSHWERRIFNDEFMVGDTNITDISFSEITLALFEDSGWYKVDYTFSSNPIWGYQAGCQFVNNKCVLNQVPTNTLFNVDINNELCDYKRLNKGRNNLQTYPEPIPEEYRYFPSEFYGGDKMSDYCPYVVPSRTGSCRGLGAEKTTLTDDYGETLGENSRCFEGNYTKGKAILWHVGCHVIECMDGYVNVHVGEQVVTCPFNGNEGFMAIQGYQGYISCYFASQVCNLKPCPNSCSGWGSCEYGVCHCEDGTIGGDCRQYPFGKDENDVDDGDNDGGLSSFSWIIKIEGLVLGLFIIS